jgi:hypothetical protein
MHEIASSLKLLAMTSRSCLIVIASPDTRDKLYEAISDTSLSPRIAATTCFGLTLSGFLIRFDILFEFDPYTESEIQTHFAGYHYPSHLNLLQHCLKHVSQRSDQNVIAIPEIFVSKNTKRQGRTA